MIIPRCTSDVVPIGLMSYKNFHFYNNIHFVYKIDHHNEMWWPLVCRQNHIFYNNINHWQHPIDHQNIVFYHINLFSNQMFVSHTNCFVHLDILNSVLVWLMMTNIEVYWLDKVHVLVPTRQ